MNKERKQKERFAHAALCAVLMALIALPATAQTQVPYTFQNVLIGCQGQVTEITSHPLNGNLVYVRGDGGMYRFNSSTGAWIAISDNLPPVAGGITPGGASIPEALGLDPNNQNIIYTGIGGGICRSTNQGNSWSAVTQILNSSGAPITQNWNNFPGKNENNRIAVDPNNSSVVYYGTYQDGVYKSTNSGSSWAKITSLPTDTAPGDVVAFDSGGGTTTVNGQTVCAIVYVGVSAGTSTDNGVWKSTNGGTSWTHLGGYAMDVEQAMITTNGNLYVVGAATGPVGLVTRGGGTVVNITPSTASTYDAIAVDVTDSSGNTAMVCDNQYCNSSGCQHVFRTTNGGATWTTAVGSGVNPVTWSYEPGPPCQTIQTCCFNSGNGQIGWIGDSFGPWESGNATASSPTWTVTWGVAGSSYEGCTSMWPFCPPSGAPLLIGCMDPAAFRSSNVTSFPTEVYPVGGRVATIAWCETNPNYVALTSDGSYYGYTGNSGYSLSTNNMATTSNYVPGNYGGEIAVGATLQSTGYPDIVWMPTSSALVLQSSNWGSTWNTVSGMPDCRIAYWQSQQILCADRVNGSEFYLFNFNNGNVLQSANGGASFSVVNSSSFSSAGNTGFQLTGQPGGPTGKLWANPNGGNMLSYSTNGGVAWTQVANIPVCSFYALGKPASGYTTPCLYVNGTVTINGTNYGGIFRSDNATSLTGTLSGATWVQIWNPSTSTQIPYRMTGMGADENTYGKLYFTVGGRGTLVGNPGSGSPPSAPTGLTASAGNGQVSLSWTASSGATSYNVYRGTTSGGESATAISTGITSVSYTNTGLTNGTTYYYKVAAVNAGGTSANSSEVNAVAGSDAQVPYATTTPVINGSSSAAWLGATIYDLPNVVGTIPSGQTNSATYQALWNSTDLYVLVTVQDSALVANTNEGLGDSVEVYVDGTNGKATSYSATDWQFLFPWNGTTIQEFQSGTQGTNITGIQLGQSNITGGYIIEVAIPWSTIGVASPSGNSLIGLDVAINNSDVLGTRCNKLFWWSTVDNDWTNPSLFGTAKLLANPVPAAPTGLTATPGNFQVALTWTASSGATSYNLYRGTTSGAESATAIATGLTTTSYANTGLTNGVTYYYEVKALNSSGTSGVSNEAHAAPASSPTQVSLSSSFNIVGIEPDGTAFSGGLDGGNSYSGNLLGTSQTWSSTTFTIGPQAANDAVTSTGQVITLPAGNFSTLKMLACSVLGASTSQTFTVKYTDGTTSPFTQSLSDWCNSQAYTGESIAVAMTYRDQGAGTKQTINCNLYGYSFALNKAKVVQSITLPNTADVKVLAITLAP